MAGNIMDPIIITIPRVIKVEDELEMDFVANDEGKFSISLICDCNPESSPPCEVEYIIEVDLDKSNNVDKQVLNSDRKFKLGIVFKYPRAVTLINGEFVSHTEVLHPIGSIRYLHCWNGIKKVECLTFKYK